MSARSIRARYQSPDARPAPGTAAVQEHRCVSVARWADSGTCSALCQLILDDRKGSGVGDASSSKAASVRRALPPALWAENVAPFLRFDAPLPNMLYAFGGRNQGRGPLSTVEMFDTWYGRWVPCAPMPTRRAGSGAAVLPDNRIMVIGGYNERGIAEGLLATCDAYNPYTKTWDSDGIAPLARRRWGHGCASLGGKVYAVGGCSLPPNAQTEEAFMETLRCCEVYHPDKNRWTACAPLQIPRSGSRVVALDERYLAAVGGCDDVFGRAETQPTVEVYDSSTGVWSLLASRLENPRTTAAVAAMDSGRLLVVGGAPSLSSAELYQVRLPKEQGSPSRRNARQGSTCPRSFANASEAETCGSEEIHVLPKIANMTEGRMGCQAAVVKLPRPGASYPVTDRPCVVIVGGERCDEEGTGGDWPRVRQFESIPVFDVFDNKWLGDSESLIPSMTAPRTAVALCVGVGYVSSEHTLSQVRRDSATEDL